MECRLPYFKFYPGDWLSDRPVRMLSPEARGVYFDLLCTAWREGGIPADPEALQELAQWLRIDVETFNRVWPELSALWVRGENGELVNPRQEAEREAAAKLHRKRVSAGRKGGRPRKSK